MTISTDLSTRPVNLASGNRYADTESIGGMSLPVDPCLLYLGTRDGIRVARLTDGGLEVVERGIAGHVVRDIAIHPADPADVFIGCGLRGWGLHHTADAGATVDSLGFDDRWVWGVVRHPSDPETIYVGTEPPMLYRSTDNGSTFDPLDGIDALPSRSRWTFFHEPFKAGHIHGISLHPDRPERIFAGVEHGALIYSPDGGETWHETLVGSDVHRVAVDPTDPDHVLAATGAGLYRSFDAGDAWVQPRELRGLYLHTVFFDPDSPTRLYVYAARADDPVLTSRDGGDTWSAIGEGLPASRPADNLRRHPTDPETLLYAGDTAEQTSHLFVSPDAGQSWTQVGEPLPKVWRVAVAPDTA